MNRLLIVSLLCFLVCAFAKTSVLRGEHEHENGRSEHATPIKDVSSCFPNPCLNNGTCEYYNLYNGSYAYRCSCPYRYTGNYCERIVTAPCASSPCMNGGICYGYRDSYYSCSCPYNTTGMRCEVKISSCDMNVCWNGGSCVLYKNETGSHTYCYCPNWYDGERCQIHVYDPCLSNPCKNGGFCSGWPNYYHCNCPANTTGSQCEVQIHSCDYNRCYNGGTCRLYSNSTHNYTSCQCSEWYYGERCEYRRPNPCSSSPCANGGSCISSMYYYYCICPPYVTGTNCNVTMDSCVYNYNCMNGGTCINSRCYCPYSYSGRHCENHSGDNFCTSSFCYNGGTCINDGHQARCLCPYGYNGTRCENRIYWNPCNSSPCRNGGECVGYYSGFYCNCPYWSYGTFCEYIRSYACASNPCLNGATCYPDNFNFTCICASGFTGRYCESHSIPSSPCASNPCSNGGTCSNSYIPGTAVCVCPCGYAGKYCERRTIFVGGNMYEYSMQRNLFGVRWYYDCTVTDMNTRMTGVSGHKTTEQAALDAALSDLFTVIGNYAANRVSASASPLSASLREKDKVPLFVAP